MSNELNSSLQYLKSVGPKRAEWMASSGLRTIRDLLFYFPTRYLDRTTMLTVAQAVGYVEAGFEGEITVIGTVVDSTTRAVNKKTILIVKLRDRSGVFECVWFQAAQWYKDKFRAGQVYAVSGKPGFGRYGELQFSHPDFDVLSDEESNNFVNTGKIIPFYKIPAALKARNMGDLSFRKITGLAVEHYIKYLTETLPDALVTKYKFPSVTQMVKALHYPSGKEELAAARRRLKFEELFYLELLIALRKYNYKEEQPGISLAVRTQLVKKFLSSLPFELTKAQLSVLSEIRIDMASPKPMNRLLQGDVGSGKTIVALIAMLIAIDSGKQSVLMVPTEILADQHSRNIKRLLAPLQDMFPELPLGVETVFGSQKKKEREAALANIASGTASVVIGTHALFEEGVQFKDLGLVVIDEQHRFGVIQRALLQSKGTTPDVLVMSATPIPRTLSMTVYGDLDISVINEMPRDRIPIKTYLKGERQTEQVYAFIREEITQRNNQAFIVFPLVAESEKLELKAAEQHYEEIKEKWLPGIPVGMVHGKMKWQQKEAEMEKFLSGEYKVLVATTVIEVGIDIPNANIMLIHDAHRFGLSQLHQLRGRIGRGNKQSHCILSAPDSIIASSARVAKNLEYLAPGVLEKYRASVRLQTMVQFTDGFKIAEMDMKLRGPGDVFGIKQSGVPDLKYTDLAEDVEILAAAKEEAFAIIERDPDIKNPEHGVVRINLQLHYSDAVKYAGIA